MSVIVHIAERAAWQAAQETGDYRTPSLEFEGFIHFSTPSQVLQVANFFYAGSSDLVLLVVDPEALIATLRYEALIREESTEQFPHLYGPLNLDAVTKVLSFPSRADGLFDLPFELSG